MGKKAVEAYCRLCAELKTINELINLQTDVKKYQEIMSQLTRFNVEVDLNDNIWPKTVCFKCTTSLNRAFDFVAAVEQAQTTMKDLVSVNRIKDRCDTENENIDIETPELKEVLVAESKHHVKSLLKNGDSKSKSISHGTSCRAKKTNIILSWKEYTWLCIHCRKRLKNVDELKIHSLHYHNTCNAYQCLDCKTKKYNLNKFIVHIRRHRQYLKFSCYKCFMKFTTFQEIEHHEATHINSDYVCFGCNTTFSSSDEINIHVTSFYKDKQARQLPVLQNESLTCSLCQKTLKSRLCLDRHLLLHTNRKRDYICDVCGKGFFRKRALVEHIVTHSDKRPHQCEICKFSFKLSSELRYHATVHFGEKSFACIICDKKFLRNKELTRHSKIHSDVLPYTCTHCIKAFRFKHLLTQHIRTHTGVKPYICDICEHKFTNWPNYNKHMKQTHGIDKSRRKHTPGGPHAVDPVTGKVIYPETEKMLDWKKKILEPKKGGRPKQNINVDKVKYMSKKKSRSK